jgi:CTP:molybdopterin cytidylyltransferase MocA
MMPPHGNSRAERWVAEGIRATALDLIHRLHDLGLDLEIYVLAAEKEDREVVKDHPVQVLQNKGTPFHFGRALIDFIQEFETDQVAYFGAGSAPLLSESILGESIQKVVGEERPFAVVNNLHSTDWAVITHARSLTGFWEQLPSDNPLGWILSREAHYRVVTLPISAATRADIDTPADLFMVRRHPDLGPFLKEFLAGGHLEGDTCLDEVRCVLSTPASHLTLIGRSSSHVWQELERRTQIWMRFFVEERGMIASGRMSRGEVKSLIAEFVDTAGPQSFVSYLASISDAVLWDTRVWMAHHGSWPSRADRFASDLGWVDEIDDLPLRELTEAILKAPIPIVTGGHGVVAGGLYTLLESLDPSE